jgi:hypothetical protein
VGAGRPRFPSGTIRLVFNSLPLNLLGRNDSCSLMEAAFLKTLRCTPRNAFLLPILLWASITSLVRTGGKTPRVRSSVC